MEGLTLKIHPDGEQVSLDLFQRTIRDVSYLIKDVDYAVTREKGTRRWVIEKLQSSIPTITIRHLLDQSEIVKTIYSGVQSVSEGALEPPAHFTQDALEHLKRMNKLFIGHDRLKRIDLSLNGGSIVLHDGIGDNVDRILRSGQWNLGSLEGMLEEVNLHGNPSFTIWDRVSRSPVRCYFPKEEEWKEKVKTMLEKRVLVVGRVRYFHNGVPRSISQIVELEDRTPRTDLPTANFGSIPSNEEEKDIVGFLHRVRQGG